MSELLEWLKTWDWNAVLATIISFASVYGATIIALVIGIIKSRIKNFNYQEALDKTKIQLSNEQKEQIEKFQNDMLSKLEALELNILSTNKAANDERIKILKEALGEAEQATEKLEPVEPLHQDANSILDSLE